MKKAFLALFCIIAMGILALIYVNENLPRAHDAQESRRVYLSVVNWCETNHIRVVSGDIFVRPRRGATDIIFNSKFTDDQIAKIAAEIVPGNRVVRFVSNSGLVLRTN